jgi:predicted glycosyltransferase involved in capsule biosynthesis
MHKLSALIPYKPDKGRRDYLWSFVRQRYEQLLPQVELCIGYDDSELFCRAKAINEAAKKATGDIFMLTDIDLVFDPGLIDQILQTIQLYPWIIPFSNVSRLTKEVTDRFMAEGLQLNEIRLRKEDVEFSKIVTGAYINVMPRSGFEAVGGLDERFKGYGFEDVALAFSLETICGKHCRLEGTIYHLWHAPASLYHKNYQFSRDLCRQYKAAYRDVVQMKNLIRERSATEEVFLDTTR